MLKPYQKITLQYFIVGVLWIFFSDQILEATINSPKTLTAFQTYKGWFFIFTTSLLLYFLTKKMWYAIEEREAEKKAVFLSTMRAVQHILNNFLNKMMFFKHIAAEEHNLKEDIIEHYEHVISETSKQVSALSSIKDISADEIERVVYKK